jgi:hypothetical protein
MSEVFALSKARNCSARNFEEKERRSKNHESRNFKENERRKEYE